MARKKSEFDKNEPYNPLDKTNLGESVAEALLSSDLSKLPPEPFKGSGVYAIYYMGPLPAYAKVRAKNLAGVVDTPIYVGKAVPKGARKGNLDSDGDLGDRLFQRLREHAESIALTDLNLSDFKCRYLVVDDIWIPLGESLLIREFQPLWNVLLEGFGNHDPGGRRTKGETSRWDTVHPGRPWVKRRELSANQKSRDQWLKEVVHYLATGKSADLVREDEIGYSSEEEPE